MRITPLGDRILVKILKTEEKTTSGILLPDSAKEKKAAGEVVAIGNGEVVTKLNLKIGDKVLFGKYSGEDVEMDNDKAEYKILAASNKVKEDEILAIMA